MCLVLASSLPLQSGMLTRDQNVHVCHSLSPAKIFMATRAMEKYTDDLLNDQQILSPR